MSQKSFSFADGAEALFFADSALDLVSAAASPALFSHFLGAKKFFFFD